MKRPLPLSPPQRPAVPPSTAIAIVTAWLAVCSMAGAQADDTGGGPLAIHLSSGLMGTGSALFPEYEATHWSRFQVTVPTGTRHVASGELVAAMDAWVTDPAHLGVALPERAQTGVVYVLDAPPGELDSKIDITFPNPEGLAAGDVHLVYAYDETNSTWVVVSAAVVSADQSVLNLTSKSNDNLLGYHFVDTNVLYHVGDGEL